MVAGRICKHTRPPKRSIVRGIVGSVVYIKNHGIGMFWKAYLEKLGLYIGESQYRRLKSIQSIQVNRNEYKKKDEVKIRRSKRKTEHIKQMRRINELRGREIHKSDVNLESLRKKKRKEPEKDTNSRPRHRRRTRRKRRKVSNDNPTTSTSTPTITATTTPSPAPNIPPPLENMTPPISNMLPPVPNILRSVPNMSPALATNLSLNLNQDDNPGIFNNIPHFNIFGKGYVARIGQNKFGNDTGPQLVPDIMTQKTG